MAKTKTEFANCAYTTFIKNGAKDGDRLDNFLDKYVEDENEIIVTPHVTSPFIKLSI